MKRKFIVVFALIAAFCLLPLSGCFSKRISEGGEYVVQIRNLKAGYGDEWLYEAVDLFNDMYEADGYSARVEESSAGITTDEVVAQTKDYQNNNVDLYIVTGGAGLLKLVDASPQILRTNEYTLMEDLSGIYSSNAIGLDKKEESGTIGGKMSDISKLYTQYYGKLEDWQGTPFLYQWTSASSGFLYNQEVLNDYGITEVPRTTTEFKEAFDKILSEGKADSVYPVSWGGDNASGYWQYPTETWYAQYVGEDAYLDFYRLKPKTGTTLENGWSVYDDEGWLYALENLETFCDTDYAAPGTLTTVDHLGAQDLFLKGKAAFCTTGDWMYNEMYKDPAYSESIGDIRVMRLPVVSQLGTKLNLHSDPDTCDDILSEIIKGVDENDTNEEIISAVKAAYSVTLTDDQVKAVRQARGVYYDLGYQHQAFIPYHSDAKEPAKLFLRFIASNDFQTVYREKAHGNLPFDYTLADGETLTEYQKSLDVLTHSENSVGICEANHLSEIRAAAGITAVPSVGAWATLIKGMAADSNGYTASEIYQKNLQSVSGDNWTLLLETAGLA